MNASHERQKRVPSSSYLSKYLVSRRQFSAWALIVAVQKILEMKHVFYVQVFVALAFF